jgi:4-hydroxy-tetrahydrodipicolinate reductase
MTIMPEPYKILQFGFGTIGRSIAEAIIKRDNLELTGVIDINPELTGKQVELLLSIDSETITTIHTDLSPFSNQIELREIDAVIIATSSSLEKIVPTINSCLERGLDVISLCEELSFPYVRYPAISESIHNAAIKYEKTVLGTGINPGYLMDLLPIILSSPCQTLTRIEVTRCINSARRRTSFQKKIGTGLSEVEFRDSIEKGIITGHVGLIESIYMLSDALGLSLSRVDELPPEPVLAKEAIETPYTKVSKGYVIGLKSEALGLKGDEVSVSLKFHAYAGASPEYDEIRIEGFPEIIQRIEGGIMGDYGTVGMVINMIPLVINAAPGLLTMKDIPGPRNTERMWKSSK